MLSEDKICGCLKRKIPVVVYDVTDSTNTQAHRFLAENDCERMVFAANGQTNGRGRLGRSFYSPSETGIYMTYVFRTESIGRDTVRITTAASVAVARALDCGAKIKWVNDLYLDGKKICGILTEACPAGPEGQTYILVGIGINLTTKEFPDSLRATAGSANVQREREELIAAICDDLSQIADDPADTKYLDYYRKHLLGVGQRAVYTENGREHRGVILGVDDGGGLIVAEDGGERILRSGEITFVGPPAAGTGPEKMLDL